MPSGRNREPKSPFISVCNRMKRRVSSLFRKEAPKTAINDRCANYELGGHTGVAGGTYFHATRNPSDSGDAHTTKNQFCRPRSRHTLSISLSLSGCHLPRTKLPKIHFYNICDKTKPMPALTNDVSRSRAMELKPCGIPRIFKGFASQYV